MTSKIKAPPEQRTSVAPQKRESDTEETGVNVVETHEAEEEVPTREESEEVAEGEELVEVQQQSVSAKSKPKEPVERTNDPVRMYLREMGSVENHRPSRTSTTSLAPICRTEMNRRHQQRFRATMDLSDGSD